MTRNNQYITLLFCIHVYFQEKREARYSWISMAKRGWVYIWLINLPLTVHFSNVNQFSIESYWNFWFLVFVWPLTYLQPDSKWNHRENVSFIFAGMSSDLVNSQNISNVTILELSLKTVFLSMYFPIF